MEARSLPAIALVACSPWLDLQAFTVHPPSSSQPPSCVELFLAFIIYSNSVLIAGHRFCLVKMAPTGLRQCMHDVTPYLITLMLVVTLGPLQFGYHLVC